MNRREQIEKKLNQLATRLGCKIESDRFRFMAELFEDSMTNEELAIAFKHVAMNFTKIPAPAEFYKAAKGNEVNPATADAHRFAELAIQAINNYDCHHGYTAINSLGDELASRVLKNLTGNWYYYKLNADFNPEIFRATFVKTYLMYRDMQEREEKIRAIKIKNGELPPPPPPEPVRMLPPPPIQREQVFTEEKLRENRLALKKMFDALDAQQATAKELSEPQEELTLEQKKKAALEKLKLLDGGQ